MIINADCDIAQSKNSGHISWVEIIPASTYLDKYWAWDQAVKTLKKQSNNILQQVNSAIHKINPQLNELDSHNLHQWIKEHGAEKMCTQINIRDENILNRLIACENFLKTNREQFSFDALTILCAAFGTEAKKLQTEALKYLGRTADFPDFVLVPGMPGQMEQAFVVMLRNIMGWRQDYIYTSETAALIRDDRYAFYRVGRFSDTLRFQIVQKLCFLFLRIGSSADYDGDCDAVLDLMNNKLWGDGTYV